MTRVSRRGPWLPEEDGALIELVRTQGPNNWVRISQQLQHRSPKQCRERYHQNLKPSLNHEPISAQEGELIEQLVDDMGKRWAEIARRLGNRSDNAVKNWWNGSMNRRKRAPSQNNHLKHLGNRLHPISSTKLQRSYCSLPPGVIIRQGEVLPDSTHAHNRWSAPESSLMNQQTLQLPAVRLQCSSENDILFSRPVHHASAGTASHHYSADQHSSPNPYRSGLESSRLPPLRLPPLSNHVADFNHIWDKPSPSPAISEFSQTVSTRPPPSLVSDTQSNFSTSPRTMVSSQPSAYPSEPAPPMRTKDDRSQPHDYQGIHGQMALSPLNSEPTPLPHSSMSDEARRSACTSMNRLSTGSCSSYNTLFTPRNEPLKDNRMHVSSLVQ